MPANHYATWVKRASTAAIVVAIILVIIKGVCWLYTGSAALLASLLDSLIDALASAVNYAAIRWATKPPDANHRFGHGKVEAIAALAQSGFIAGSALLLAMHGIDRMLNPTIVKNLPIGLTAMAIAMLLTVALVAFQTVAIAKTDSTAIRADRLHYQSDILMNLAVFSSLALTWYGWQAADAWFALAIACYMLFSVVAIIRHAFSHLMDHELSPDERQLIIDKVLEHPEVRGYHDLRTRQSAGTRFVQLHLELDGSLSLTQAHTICDQVERDVADLFELADVIIHQDVAAK
ncbi:ferrous-iron efflux pump FieF [Neiella marina]|uniref:Ferrous-iron efflux pump FieF n=1 Tax=Neiella marina TaxID=508461 RepID=A0A8J2XRG0_9GAMM|nr:cation diffusion facilitator family transporter [Neiella marina]GGA89003.1 ferrous-iron efflux pump FieF [Neiella marina]